MGDGVQYLCPRRRISSSHYRLPSLLRLFAGSLPLDLEEWVRQPNAIEPQRTEAGLLAMVVATKRVRRLRDLGESGAGRGWSTDQLAKVLGLSRLRQGGASVVAPLSLANTSQDRRTTDRSQRPRLRIRR